MTVAELILALQQYDPKLRVIVKGYEGGYDDADYAEQLKIGLDVHTAWYYGKHEDADAWYVKEAKDPEIKIENAVLIG